MPNTPVRATGKAMPAVNINRRRTAKEQRRALSSFIAACLDPLPPEVLIDTDYNRLMRRTRLAAWQKVEVVTGKFEATRALYSAEWSYATVYRKDREKANRARDKEFELLDPLRESRVIQIMTPAPDERAVAWKRKAAKDSYLPIRDVRIEDAIARDEDFLANHPVSRRKALALLKMQGT